MFPEKPPLPPPPAAPAALFCNRLTILCLPVSRPWSLWSLCQRGQQLQPGSKLLVSDDSHGLAADTPGVWDEPQLAGIATSSEPAPCILYLALRLLTRQPPSLRAKPWAGSRDQGDRRKTGSFPSPGPRIPWEETDIEQRPLGCMPGGRSGRC